MISGRETVRLVTYSDYDPIELPRVLVDELHHFDGRATTETLDELERESGLRLDPALVRKLVDFRVLCDEDPD